MLIRDIRQVRTYIPTIREIVSKQSKITGRSDGRHGGRGSTVVATNRTLPVAEEAVVEGIGLGQQRSDLIKS